VGGQLTVNGVAITEPYLKPGDNAAGGRGSFDIIVPAGKVWVMGDHRSDSADSRFHDDGTGSTGSVPIADIRGKAVLVVWPIDRWAGLSEFGDVFATVPDPGKAAPGDSVVTPSSTPDSSSSRDSAGPAAP
jgi:signal peptidase I